MRSERASRGVADAVAIPWDCFVTMFLAMTTSALGEDGRGFDATSPSLRGRFSIPKLFKS